MNTPFRLDEVTLVAGHHGNLLTTKRGCVNDVISVLSGCQAVTDHPPCVCPVLNEFSIMVNDLPAHPALRTRLLRPLMPLMMESRDPSLERARAELLAGLALRVFAPMALRAEGLRRDAFAIRRAFRLGGPARAARVARVARAAANATNATNATWAAESAGDAWDARDARDAEDAGATVKFAARAARAAWDWDAGGAGGPGDPGCERIFRVAVAALRRACLVGLTEHDIEAKQRRFDEALAAQETA